ncbi:MAG: ketopantoate reductase family protein [Eubacteriales bacterium]|nr:ketopantoate reductase family protein [Eubacteriales bacterium]
MEIQTVTIVGLGALGTLFGHQLAKHMPKENLRILADENRIARYQRDGVFSNGEKCDFHFVTPKEALPPADLVLVAVKFGQLQSALETMRGQVGENTLILSLLNGISSEEVIGKVYGREKIVDCVAYGMDAVKVGNKLTFGHMGKLCIGTHLQGKPTEAVQRIARFFAAHDFPYEVDEAMGKRMWGKFMLNVGVNQTLAVFGPNYGALQKEGLQRDTMIAAMREVIALSQPEGAHLTEEDLTYWLDLLSTLNPEGKASMRQDVEAKRPSEVGLFAGTVIALAEKHGLDVPVNRMLLKRVGEMEAQY